MPLILAGIPVSNVWPQGPRCAPVAGPSDVPAVFSRMLAPDPARSRTPSISRRDGHEETQARRVDIVYLVPWEPAARRHRWFGELHDRPGQGATPTWHTGPGSHHRPRHTRWQGR